MLSFAMLPEYFPKESSGRANAALNILHLSGAFLLQWLTGATIELWPVIDGHSSVMAYQAAFGANVVMQLLALGWFVWPRKRARWIVYAHSTFGQRDDGIWSGDARYTNALAIWSEYLANARSSAALWQRAGLAAAALCVLLLAALPPILTRPAIPHIIEIASEPAPHRAASAGPTVFRATR